MSTVYRVRYAGQCVRSWRDWCLVVLDAHPSNRLDPKFHLFQSERIQNPPPHMTKCRLGDLLKRREEKVDPTEYPDQEFLTLTLSQDGTLAPREAGKGNNPPSWHGAYFTKGSRWFRAQAGDLIISQIDMWSGSQRRWGEPQTCDEACRLVSSAQRWTGQGRTPSLTLLHWRGREPVRCRAGCRRLWEDCFQASPCCYPIRPAFCLFLAPDYPD